jgi:hypothetical protein
MIYRLIAEHLLRLQSNEAILTQESKRFRNKIKREMKCSLIRENVGDVVQGAKGLLNSSSRSSMVTASKTLESRTSNDVFSAHETALQP